MSTLGETQYKAVPAKENNEPEKCDIPETFRYGVRHIQAFIVFVSLAVGFVARGHLGISIVAMTDPAIENNTEDITPYDNDYTNHSAIQDNVMDLTLLNETILKVEIVDADIIVNKSSDIFTIYKTYKWPKSVQEMVLSAFFLGYCIMMFPMGMVCQRWGGKLPIQIALFVNGVVSILTPHLAAWGGWKAVFACRLMQGLSQSGFYPSIQTLIANWAPISERGRISSYTYMGSVFGTILAFQIGGSLAASSWGWPSNFWATGALCLVMFTIVTVFTAATPLSHKSISVEERDFILGRAHDGKKKVHKVPWKALFGTKAVWASISAHVGGGISFVFFFVQVPSYIHYILNVNVKNSGLLSSLPYVGGFLTSILFGVMSDFCTNRKIISIQNARRVSNTIAHCGLAVSLLMVSFTKNVELAVCCLVLALSTNAGVHTGWMLNYTDLAPNYTATLMATGNTVTSLGYFILPVMISYIVTDVTNQYQWRIIFIIIASIAVVSNAIFVIFMSAKTQPWNEFSNEKEKAVAA